MTVLALVLAARVVAALDDTGREPLQGFADRIGAMLVALYGKAGEDLRAAIDGSAPASDPLGRAFLAGQLSMARAIASQGLAERPADPFFDLFGQDGPRAILGALASDLRAEDVADMTGRGLDETQADLAAMEEAGLVSRRLDAGEEVYARTPNALAMLAHQIGYSERRT